MKGRSIGQYSALRGMYFRDHMRVPYIAQTVCKKSQVKANQAAFELGLGYEYRYARYGELYGVIRGLPYQGGGITTRNIPH